MKRRRQPEFINKRQINSLLKALNCSASELSTALGWGRDTLPKYLRYQNKISKDKIDELADYFGQNPSSFIDYRPTLKIQKDYAKYQREREQRERTDIPKNLEASKIVAGISKNDFELTKNSLVNIITELNKERQENAELKREVSELKDFIKKLSEQEATRQGYTVKLLKDINSSLEQLKLAARFNR